MLGVVLQAAAITLVFVRGSIFDWFRAHGPAWWRTLAGCPLCAGFWVGAIGDFCVRAQVHAVSTQTSLGLGFYAAYLGSGGGAGVFHALAAGALTAVLALTITRVWDVLEQAAEVLERRGDLAAYEAKNKQMVEDLRGKRYSP